MGKTYKILQIVLAVFFFIALSEIFYYFLLTSPQQTQTSFSEKLEKQTGQSPTEEPTTTASPDEKKDLENQAISQQALDYLKTFQKNALTTSMVINRLHGTISQIDTEGGVTDKGLKYEAKITIREETGVSASFYLTEEDSDAFFVYQKIEDGLAPISLYDLGIGDEVEIKENLDLLLNKRYEFVVTRY